jgi:hypothetical protein
MNAKTNDVREIAKEAFGKPPQSHWSTPFLSCFIVVASTTKIAFTTVLALTAAIFD